MLKQADCYACPEYHQNTKKEKGKVHDGENVVREGAVKQS
jgi:hypothetical protein